MAELAPGLTGECRWSVTEDLTAARIGSGLVAVFSTPMLVGLMESAAVDALKDALEPGLTSVGTRIDVKHLAATPVGLHVRALATLKEVDGRRLIYENEAWHEVDKIGEAAPEPVNVNMYPY